MVAPLAANEEPLASLGDWVWDAASGALTFSPQLLRVYGIEAQDLSSVRGTFLVRVHPSDRMRTRSAATRALRAGGPFQFEQRIVRGDGAVRLLRTRGHVARDNAGRCVHILGISHDITSARPTKTRARDEQSYGEMIDSARGYAMLLLDPHGDILSWDPAAVRMFGASADDMKGAGIATLYPPEDIEASIPALHLRAAESEHRCEREGWRLRRDGTKFWSQVALLAIRDASEKITGFACVIQDLTWRRRIEEQLRSQRERLVLAARSVADADEGERRRMGREVSDGIGEPLLALEANLQTLGNGLAKESREAAVLDESLRTLRGVTQVARGIADQLGRVTLDEHGLLAALQIAAGKVSRQAAIPVHLNGDHHPSSLGIGIETALYRVALDLLDSAAKRSRCTLVRVSLERTPTSARLKIGDNGRVTEEGAATALLHAISPAARARAEAAGISIHVTAQPDVGTCVTLSADVN